MAAQIGAEVTPQEREKWGGDPKDWPHTPPAAVFKELWDENPNFAWYVDTGHLVNLLEELLYD